MEIILNIESDADQVFPTHAEFDFHLDWTEWARKVGKSGRLDWFEFLDW